MENQIVDKILYGLCRHHIFSDCYIKVAEDGSFSYYDKDFKFNSYNVVDPDSLTFFEILDLESGKKWPGYAHSAPEMNHFAEHSFIKIRLEKKWHEVEIDDISESQTVGFFLIEFMKYARSS